MQLFLKITFFLSSSLLFSQTFSIVKILDTNLFELDNGQKVKLYGLYIPSESDTNNALSTLAHQIYEWENDFLLDRDFRMEYVREDLEDISEVIFYKTYAFSEEDLAKRFLSSGYASLKMDADKNYLNKLLPYQVKAQKSSLGIWKHTAFTLNTISDSNVEPNNKIETHLNQYEQPYLPLLGVSVAAFALSWDNFASASDLQKSIDEFKSINPYSDTSKLESSKTRKSVVGIVCLAAGVITTLFALKSVEVKASFNSISLTYKF